MKDRTHADSAFRSDGAAVDFGDPAGDRQTEAGSRGFARAGDVGASEALENALQVRWRDANAGVTHGNVRLLVVVRQLDSAATAGRRVFDGVIDEDKQQAINRDGVGVYPDGRRRHLRGELKDFVSRQDDGTLLRFAYAFADIERMHFEASGSGIRTTESEEVFEQLGSFHGSLEDSAEGLAILSVRARPAQGNFGGGADDGDRSAKVVGSVPRELRDSAEGLLDAIEHGVESLGQLAQFVVRFREFEAARKALDANRLGGFDNSCDGCERSPAEPIA